MSSIETLADNVRVARKDHTCLLCRRTIEAGQKYRDARFADDGRAYTWREHLRCGEWAYRRAAEVGWDYGVDHVNFIDWLTDEEVEMRCPGNSPDTAARNAGLTHCAECCYGLGYVAASEEDARHLRWVLETLGKPVTEELRRLTA